MTIVSPDTRDYRPPDPIGVRSRISNRLQQSSRFSSGKSLLFDSIRYGPVKTARDLLKQAPNLAQTTDNRGYTPLHFAAMYGPPAMVRILRQAGAKIDAQDHSGNTPLHCSCAETTVALIAMDASIEMQNLRGSTALHLAAKMGEEEKVGILLAANANVHAQDKLQNTPLHYAAWGGHYKIVGMVLGRGANVDSFNRLRMTPLSFAVAKPISHPALDQIVSLLLSASADVHIPDCDGNTALHHAAVKRDSGTLKLLLHGGADIHLANLKGLTVWNLAQRLPGRHGMQKIISEMLHEITHQRNTLKVNGGHEMICSYFQECHLCCCESSLGNFPQSLHLKDHDICRSCIAKYIKIKILDRGELDLPCPDGGCGELLEYGEVKMYCVQSTFVMYQPLRQFPLTSVSDMINFCSRGHWNRTQTSDIVQINPVPLDKSC